MGCEGREQRCVAVVYDTFLCFSVSFAGDIRPEFLR